MFKYYNAIISTISDNKKIKNHKPNTGINKLYIDSTKLNRFK